MTRSTLRRYSLLIIVAALCAAGFFYARSLHAAEEGLPIYFEDSTLTVKAQNLNRTIYIPLIDLVNHLHLPWTDATLVETFTIGSTNARVGLAKNSRFISVNDQYVLLENPILRENQQWLVPIDFLSQGLTRITGIEFRYKPGRPRIFAGKVNPIELVMNAQALGSITRLTIGTSTPVRMELQRDAVNHRAVLLMGQKAVDPLRDKLDYRDRLVRSIGFDDSDGAPKVVVDTADNIGDVRVSTAEEGRVHFVDFLRPGVITEALPAATAVPAVADAASKLDAASSKGVRVIVIDPGHGGIDTGAATAGIAEKDLTLTISRALRTELKGRLGLTVLLTRDSDVALTSEARAAVANNNQADLFISLHVGYSLDKSDVVATIYLIKEDFAAKLTPTASQDRMFLPWYMGYQPSRQASAAFAGMLQEELTKASPGIKIPRRSGPVAVLASTTMPSVSLEIGNLNTSGSPQKIMDSGFQNHIVSGIVNAVERFVAARRGGA